MEKLKYLSVRIADQLHNDIKLNLSRYRSGDFLDMADGNGWSIELNSLTIDTDKLKDLEGTKGVDAEVKNSMLVWDALPGMTPSLACENRIWTRLTHIECLTYSRERWLNNSTDPSAIKSIQDHFFADSLTKCRDDNAVSRLWWNSYIAKRIFPDDQLSALNILLKKADIRSNLIERSWLVSRPNISSAIIKIMIKEAWLTDREENFRSFMKTINKYGGGILFESMNDSELYNFVSECMNRARN